MAIEINTKVSVGESYGKKVGNLTLEDAKFFGKPNFAGELDRFKDDRRKFTVLIPNDVADQLRALGWNVKTTIPQTEDEEPLSHLKVFLNFKFAENHPGDVNYETGPAVWIRLNGVPEKLTSKTVGLLDKARFETLDMEIRGWEYDPEDNAGMLSARLVELVATIRPSILGDKYGMMG